MEYISDDQINCVICENSFKSPNKCMINVNCGHSICGDCGSQLKLCPFCRKPLNLSEIDYFNSFDPDEDLFCSCCNRPLSSDGFYPFYDCKSQTCVCSLCVAGRSQKQNQYVRFTQVAQIGKDSRFKIINKMNECTHDGSNHLFCMNHLVDFCKICHYKSFSVHKSHTILDAAAKQKMLGKIRQKVIDVRKHAPKEIIKYMRDLKTQMQQLQSNKEENHPDVKHLISSVKKNHLYFQVTFQLENLVEQMWENFENIEKGNKEIDSTLILFYIFETYQILFLQLQYRELLAELQKEV